MGFDDLPEITDENYKVLTGQKKQTVIAFYGDNCSGCEEIGPSMGSIVQNYSGAQFVKARHNGEIAKKYGVVAAPFFVILEQGELKGRVPGLVGLEKDGRSALPVDRLIEKLNRHLTQTPQISSLETPNSQYAGKNLEEKIGQDNWGFSENAMTVLSRRYFARNEKGEACENVAEMFGRIAHNIASAEELYGGDVKETEKEFYQLMVSKKFMPNSPTLMNAGRGEQQLAGCFVLPIEDNMQSIGYNVGDTALIHKSGGGTGFSFSHLRPAGAIVSTTYGKASGPLSFIDAVDRMTEAVNQGGFRRGANMGVLSVHHPNIREFIQCKYELDLKNKDVYESFKEKLEGLGLEEAVKETLLQNVKKSLAEKQLNNFNISVAISDEFMRAYERDGEYDLINPKNSKVVRKEKARDIMDLIAKLAWTNGEPGVIFIDEMNKHNPTPALGKIESTNPCGEQPLLPYEACNLGSINLGLMVKDGKLDYNQLEKTVSSAVHFLDNVIDMSKYPKVHILNKEDDPNRIEHLVKGNRKIGMGIMGLYDMLIEMGLPYDSEQAIKTTGEVMEFIQKTGRAASCKLAEKRGVFPNWKGSIYDSESPNFQGEACKLRNATVTTIAPTGTISMIADASSGCEPPFDVKATKHVLDGEALVYLYPKLEEKLAERGIDSKKVLADMKLEKKKFHEIGYVPEDLKRLFATSHTISAENHIKMQAMIQRHTDNAVSKTINMPSDATIEDVKNAYLLAYKSGCKGLTVYRDGSRDKQVYTSESSEKKPITLEEITANDGKEIKRPEVTICFAIKTPIGQDPITREDRSMFNVIGMDEYARMTESFINVGKSGGDKTADTEAIGRLVSKMLQDGRQPEEIIHILGGIRGDSPGYGKGNKMIWSVSDGVSQNMSAVVKGDYVELLKKTAKAYEMRVKSKKEKNGVEKKTNGNGNSETKKIILEKKPCPKCGCKDYEVITQEGCIKFSCCAFSPKGCS